MNKHTPSIQHQKELNARLALIMARMLILQDSFDSPDPAVSLPAWNEFATLAGALALLAYNETYLEDFRSGFMLAIRDANQEQIPSLSGADTDTIPGFGDEYEEKDP